MGQVGQPANFRVHVGVLGVADCIPEIDKRWLLREEGGFGGYNNPQRVVLLTQGLTNILQSG